MFLLAACTQAKHGSVAEELRLRSHSGVSALATHDGWTAAVAAAAQRRPAAEVYKGSYWRGVQALHQRLHGKVLVASAGLGLISQDEAIPAYSATFVAGDPDSIPAAGSPAGRRLWWELCDGSSALRALDLQQVPLAVVLPATYLRLVEPDLMALSKQHGSERLVVFGPPPGPTSRDEGLARAWVPVDARMAWKLGANVAALTPRVALHCLANFDGAFDHAHLREVARGLIADTDGPAYPRRERQTPAAVRTWIRDQLRLPAPPTSASAALSRFRASGFAFEQHAFHEAFREVQAKKETPNA